MARGSDPPAAHTRHGAAAPPNHPAFLVRAEAPGEAAAVHQVVRDAFGEQSVADLVDSLRESSDWIEGLSFVALEADRVVGHVLFTRSRLDTPTQLIDVLQLSPLSVATDRQRSGIGSALVRHGLGALAAAETAADAPAAGRAVGETPGSPSPVTPMPLVFLEGSPTYYARFGFLAAGPLGFRRPSLRIPPAAFQVFPLSAHRSWMTGTLIYSEAFWQHDAVGLRDGQGTTWPD